MVWKMDQSDPGDQSHENPSTEDRVGLHYWLALGSGQGAGLTAWESPEIIG